MSVADITERQSVSYMSPGYGDFRSIGGDYAFGFLKDPDDGKFRGRRYTSTIPISLFMLYTYGAF